jgi:hypothetical protein
MINVNDNAITNPATQCLPQQSPSSIIGSNGPLSNPTPAVEPQRREPLDLAAVSSDALLQSAGLRNCRSRTLSRSKSTGS